MADQKAGRQASVSFGPSADTPREALPHHTSTGESALTSSAFRDTPPTRPPIDLTPAGPLQQPSISVDPSAQDEDDEEKDTVTELPMAHLPANKVRFDPALSFNISGRDTSNSLAAETQEEREADVTLLGEKARDRMSSTVLVNRRKSIYTIEKRRSYEQRERSDCVWLETFSFYFS
jgi:hypothetical protein